MGTINTAHHRLLLLLLHYLDASLFLLELVSGTVVCLMLKRPSMKIWAKTKRQENRNLPSARGFAILSLHNPTAIILTATRNPHRQILRNFKKIPSHLKFSSSRNSRIMVPWCIAVTGILWSLLIKLDAVMGRILLFLVKMVTACCFQRFWSFP